MHKHIYKILRLIVLGILKGGLQGGQEGVKSFERFG